MQCTTKMSFITDAPKDQAQADWRKSIHKDGTTSWHEKLELHDLGAVTGPQHPAVELNRMHTPSQGKGEPMVGQPKWTSCVT